MVALLLTLAVVTTPHRTDWQSVADKFKAFGGTCAKWGITFKVEGTKELETNGPLPGKMEISGGYTTPDSLEIHVATLVGEKHSMAFQFDSTYKLDATGTATESSGSFFVEGTGISGTYANGGEGKSMTAGFEDMLLKFGIKLGDGDGGPFSFGLKLGPLTLGLDPTKYAERLKLMGPELAKKAGEKIGGVTLEVDGDALAYALAEAPAPPPDYLKSRLSVSVKAMVAGGGMGDLNDVTGVLVDEARHDIFLIGSHDDLLQPLLVERLATVEQAVYENGMHPFISIDPQGSDYTKPHKSRIGGIPDGLKQTSLIQSMLLADYSMKQLFVGTHAIDGLPSTADLMAKYSAPIVATRFWINPAPLRVGDVAISEANGTRFYAVRTTPVILTEPLQGAAGPTNSLAFDPSAELSKASENIQNEEAEALTTNYRLIERAWPESSFGAARQDLQLTNIFTLLGAAERAPWEVELLKSLGGSLIPAVTIPAEFTALDSAEVDIRGVKAHVTGGMTTSVEMPLLVHRLDSIVGADLSKSDLGPAEGEASDPALLSVDEAALRAYSQAEMAFQQKRFEAMESAARRALAMKPNWGEAAYYVLTALLSEQGNAAISASSDFNSILDDGLKASPDSWKLHLIDAQRSLVLAQGAALQSDQEKELSHATEALNFIILKVPGFSGAYEMRARIEHATGDDERSLSDWDSAISRDPLDSNMYFAEAGLLAGMGRMQDSLGRLDQAITLNPRFIRAKMVRALMKQKIGQLPEALAEAKEASQLAQTDWEAWGLLGKLQLASGLNQDCVDSIGAALALRPKDTFEGILAGDGKTHYPSFGTFMPANRWDDFIKRLGEPARPGPFMIANAVRFDPALLLTRGKALMHLSRWKDALADLEPFLKLYALDETKTEVARLVKRCKASE